LRRQRDADGFNNDKQAMINNLMAVHHGSGAPKPTMPTISVYLTWGNDIAVNWSDAPTAPAGFASYKLYRNGTEVMVGNYTAASGYDLTITRLDDVGVLTPGTNYSYYVRVYDVAGAYAQSNTVVATAVENTPPVAVSLQVNLYGTPTTDVQLWYSVTDETALSWIQYYVYDLTTSTQTAYGLVVLTGTAATGQILLALGSGASMSNTFVRGHPIRVRFQICDQAQNRWGDLYTSGAWEITKTP